LQPYIVRKMKFDKFISPLRAAVAASLLVTSFGAYAQDKPKAYLNADIVSHYMWRGTDMAGVSIQPEIQVGWKGLFINAMSSVGIEKDDLKEIDLTLGYERWGFNIGVTDYWTSGIEENDLFFKYEKRGAHQLEANLGYTCKYGSLQAYTIFWGNDYKINGDQAYSTYLELSVPFKLGGLDWSLGVGGTVFESAGTKESQTEKTSEGTITRSQYYYMYAEGPACVMASLRATKDIEVGNVSLPVFVEFHANPYLQTTHLLFGLTIRPFGSGKD